MSTIEVGGDEAQSGTEEAAGGDQGEAPSGSGQPPAEGQQEATARSDETWGAGGEAEATIQEVRSTTQTEDGPGAGRIRGDRDYKANAGQSAQHADEG